MTICNVDPYGHVDEDLLTWHEYMAAMNAKKEQWTYERLKSIIPDLTVTEYTAIWTDLFSYLGFATNLMPSTIEQVRVSRSQELIVGYFLFNKDWDEVNHTTTPRFLWNQNYQKCYTIHIPLNMTQVRAL